VPAPGRPRRPTPSSAICLILVLVIGGGWVGLKILHLTLSSVGLAPIPFNVRAGDQIVQSIAAGSLVPDAAGVVTLPRTYAAATVDGRAYVTVDPGSGTRWILLRLWQGKGCNMTAMVHCSAPAAGSTPATIHVLVPTLPNGPGSPKVPTGELDLNVARQATPNWYEAYWNLD
jgi:hypothetical protein